MVGKSDFVKASFYCRFYHFLGGVFPVAENSMDMIPQKELLPLTGYVHGGCSPIGMKKQYKTTIHINARDTEKIFFSAGKIGRQVQVSPTDLERVIPLQYYDITKGAAD